MSDCLFCKIVAKTIPAKILVENDLLVVIDDINPQAPTHVLVIPKKHIAQISDVSDDDGTLLGEIILAAKAFAEQSGIQDAYRLVINNGAKAGQSVFHIHLHLLGGRPMTWPPG